MPLESKVRRVGRPKGLTLSQDFGAACREALDGLSTVSFPCHRYQTDILGFARDVMGYTPCFTLAELVTIRDAEDAAKTPEHARQPCLWPKQVEILLAVQDAVNGTNGAPKRVVISSGHKISKSHTAALVAHWFYSSFDDAKVVLTSTTYHQVQNILWDEFRKTRYRSKVVIPGDMHQLASSGFVSEDFRSARGFTAREPEAVAGISGRNLLFILDEASGIPDAIHEAVQGNMAGGATAIMFSNPTRTSGKFFESFDPSKAAFFTTFQVSSEETPNAQTGRRLIPGLATKDFVDEMMAEFGEDSAFYKIRVKGQFVLSDESKPFSVARITDAENAWPDTPAEGRLHIGVDPAGPGGSGDETGFALRRGNKLLKLYARSGLTEDGIINEIDSLITTYGGEREITDDTMPVVSIDREGPIGYQVWLQYRARIDLGLVRKARVVGVRASDKATRRPDIYHLTRDELWGNLEAWFKNGGAIEKDPKLSKELSTIEWSQNLQGRLKATPKDDIRKLLEGRSPDRADALALAVWEPSNAPERRAAPPAQPPPVLERGGAMNPYLGVETFDPYRNI